MQKPLSIILFILLSYLSIDEAKAQKYMIDGSNDMNFVPGGMITTKPLTSGSIEGSIYIDNNWSVGNIYFDGDYYAFNKPLRYDLRSNLVEIRFEDVIKTISSTEVTKFEWVKATTGKKQYFVNMRDFKLNDVPLVGMGELLSDGKYKLFLYKKIIFLESDYVPALNVGSANLRIKQREGFYLAKGNELYEVKGGKKKVLALFGEKSETLKKFAKENKLILRTEEGLTKLVDYYNTLN